MEVILNNRNVVVLKSGDDWFDFRLGFNAYFVKDVLLYDSMGVGYNADQARSRLAGYNSDEEKLYCTTHESFLMNLAGKRKKYTFVSKVTPSYSNGLYILEGDPGRRLSFKIFLNAVLCDYVITLDINNQEIDSNIWNAFTKNVQNISLNFDKRIMKL